MLRATGKLRIAARLFLACFLVAHAVLASQMSLAAASAHGEGQALIICTDDGYKQIVLPEDAEKSTLPHECLCPAGIGCGSCGLDLQGGMAKPVPEISANISSRHFADFPRVLRLHALGSGSSRSPPASVI